MDIHDRDELWTEHDGQSRVLDYNKVADEITRLQRELAAARAEVACLTAYRDGLAKNVAELETANERLRAEALQRGVNDLWADRMDASDWTRS